jgi:glutaryl-CoA dehydrogenase
VQKGFVLALHLGRLAGAGCLRPAQVSPGKLNNARETLTIARTCRTILGASGISRPDSVLTHEGTSEIHQLVVDEALTGKSAFV